MSNNSNSIAIPEILTANTYYWSANSSADGRRRAEYPNNEVDLYRVKFRDDDGETYHNDYLSMSINPPIGEGITVEKWVAAY